MESGEKEYGKAKVGSVIRALEFRSGLAAVLTGWHPQDMRQHTLSSSFIIHALTMRYEVTV